MYAGRRVYSGAFTEGDKSRRPHLVFSFHPAPFYPSLFPSNISLFAGRRGHSHTPSKTPISDIKQLIALLIYMFMFLAQPRGIKKPLAHKKHTHTHTNCFFFFNFFVSSTSLNRKISTLH